MINIPCPEYREALKTDALYYFTGKLCNNGHLSKRRTSNRSCVECSYERTSSWRRLNTEHIQQYDRTRRQNNPGLKAQYENKRRAAKLNAEGSFTEADITDIYIKQDGKCAVCKVELSITGFHRDHKIPLSRGGSNWPNNIQLLCPSDNVRKNSLTDTEYLIKLGLAS